MDKKIANVVFYKFFGEQGVMQQACLFYEDGTVKNCSYEDGLEAAQAIAEEEGKNKQSFKEMINKERIYVLSGREFERRFKNFVIQVEEPAKVYVKNAIDEVLSQTSTGDLPMIIEEANVVPLEKVIKLDKNNKTEVEKEPAKEEKKPEINNTDQDASKKEVKETKVNPVIIPIDSTEEPKEATAVEELDDDLDEEFVSEEDIDRSTIAEEESIAENTEEELVAEEEPVAEEKASEEDSVIELSSDDEELDLDGEPVVSSKKPTTKTVIIPAIGDYPEERIEIEVPEDNLSKAADSVEDFSSDESDADEELDAFEEEEIDDAEKDERVIDIPEDNEPIEEMDQEKKEGFVKRGLRKLKNGFKRHWKKVTACVVALGLAFGLYSCGKQQTKSGDIVQNGIGIHSLFSDNANKRTKDDALQASINGETQATTESAKEAQETEVLSNDNYQGYTYEQLLKVTKNATQKAEMKRIHDALYGFNDTFANAWLEKGKDIKAALSFEEVIALSQAYNQFSPQEIKAIMNGYSFRSSELENAYKTATLQLMAAHVIESTEHPVDMSGLIVSEEGREFYNKYHKLFLAAKEAEGEEQIAAVEAFYRELHEDFPISDEIREEGIAHSDPRAELKPYKLSIVPMVAAGEIMWQNLEIDSTLKGGVANYFLDFAQFEGLTQEEILDRVAAGGNGVVYGDLDYFNDLGLCNYAEEQFEIVQQVTMAGCVNEDDTNPLYEQYRDAMVDELTREGNYVIDDNHRDLSQLDRFQDIVNWHFDINEDGYFTYQVIENTETWTQKREWTETETYTTTREEVTEEHREMPQEEKDKIDEEIDEKNKEAQEEAEKEAEERRQEMQEEEDKKTEENEKYVEDMEEDMQEKIDEANEKIDNGQTVNEDDFGEHEVDFDDEHSDEHGNLDDSVHDITKDKTGDQTGEDLPNPNDTGADFDADAPTNTYDPEEDYEVIVEEYEEDVEDQEIEEEHHEEAPKQEEHHEETPKQEEHHEEAPKQEEHHEEAPKQEEHHEEAPKQEEHHEEAPKQEEHHDNVEDQEIEEYEGEVSEEQVSQAKSNEQKAEEIVEAMAHADSQDEAEKVLVRG